MIEFMTACQTARDFFSRSTGTSELAQCRETREAWFFVGGPSNELQVGGLVVVIHKEDGRLSTIGIPTEEECVMLREAASIILPVNLQGERDGKTAAVNL